MSVGKDALDQLEQTIQSIESHKDWRAKKAADEEAAINTAWEELLAAARQLRTKLRGHDKVRYFTIARDESEVMVSFHGDGGGGSNLVSFHRRHPEGKYPTTNVIWVRRPGEDEQRFTEGKKVVEVLVRHCAKNLTGS